MRWISGVVLAVIFSAAMATWIRSSSNQVQSTRPAAEASAPMLPLELMRKSDKDLPDKTVREPF
jgi:hypothetical protein